MPRLFVSFFFVCALIAPAAVNAQEPSASAQNAVRIQALLTDSTHSATRVCLQKINPQAVADTAAKLLADKTDSKEAVASAVQMIPERLRSYLTQTAEMGLNEFFIVRDGNEKYFWAVPIGSMTPEQINKVSAFVAPSAQAPTVFERFGFLIAVPESFSADEIKARFAQPSDKERPAITSALAAAEGAAFVTAYVNAANLFDIPKVGKVSPLGKELEEKIQYSAFAVSLVGPPKAVVLIKTVDADAMKNISGGLNKLIESFKANDSVIQSAIANIMKQQGHDALADSAGSITVGAFEKIQTQIENDQMILTLELTPLLQQLCDLFGQPTAPEAPAKETAEPTP